MICEAARPFYVAALRARLDAVVSQGGSARSAEHATASLACDEAEERLRQLMAVWLGRLRARRHDVLVRREVLQRACALEAWACGPDLRFSDAFHGVHEHLGDALTPTDETDAAFLSAYARVLRAWLERLRHPATSSARSVPAPWPPQEVAEGLISHAALPRAVLILADGLDAVLRIADPLARATEGKVEIHALVCNNHGEPPVRFWVAELAHFVRRHTARVPWLLLAYVTGRLHARPCGVHHPAVVGWLRRRRFAVGLHAMGVIYRPAVLETFTRGCLNAHIGWLPEYRGRCVLEWSVLAGAPTGVSVFFMDAGIDTGADIVLRAAVDIGGATDHQQAKSSLFARDGEMYARAVRGLGVVDGVPAVNEGGRRYYVMSRLLTSVVDAVLRR